MIVCDSVGIGQAPDAESFGDKGANTLGNIYQWCQKNLKSFSLPHLSELGLNNLVPQAPKARSSQIGASAALTEISSGKDTTTGHWEIAGTPLKKNFSYFPKGFPKEFLSTWLHENKLPGFLCNESASGTSVIERFGETSIKTKQPIVYTSADSVFQVAAHEESFGLERLYQVCQSARELLNPLRVGRVIARPFSGNTHQDFKRTKNRKDFSYPPPSPNMLDILHSNEKFVAGVGKIDDIFAHRSFTHKRHTPDTESSQRAVMDLCHELQEEEGLVFANFIDFDQLYGHRRDPWGYAQALMRFDQFLPSLYQSLSSDDLLLITADHGNDPTHHGSDHTREQVPLLIYSKHPNFRAQHLGTFNGFQHVAKLCLEALKLGQHASKLNSSHHSESLWKLTHQEPT